MSSEKFLAGNLGISETRTSRLWRFQGCEFDEWRGILRIDGETSDLDSKPLEILKLFLGSPGKTHTKTDIIESVWQGATSDDSLTQAIHRLRRAIGGDRESVIKTVHRVGYRFIAPFECIVVDHPVASAATKLQKGQAVPGDDRWTLFRLIESGPWRATWLAEQTDTKEAQIFQFAMGDCGREMLSRELQAFQLLRSRYGRSAPRTPISIAQVESSPFFLQALDGGPNLREWKNFVVLPIAERLAIFALLATAVAEVHEAGLVHNDLRPESIVVSPAVDGAGWRVRLVNFTFATPLEPFSPDLQRMWREKLSREVTYRPDELRNEIAGPSPSTDMYALGVLLYQFACGDLHERPSPGWEARIADPVVQEDIAEAANGNPSLRLQSARELALRTAALGQRRAERQRQEEMSERAERAERALRLSRARRPWLAALTLTLAAGLALSLLFHARAVKANNIAESMNIFVTEDILGQDNPLLSRRGPDQTLRSAIEKAIPEIDVRFATEPRVAGQLHEIIASTLQARSQYSEAEKQYEAAATLYRKADGEQSERATAALLMEAHMDARNHVSGALPRAQKIIEQQSRALATRGASNDLQIRLLATQAVVSAEKGEAAKAWNSMQQAETLARSARNLDPSVKALLRSQSPYVDLRTGHIAEMELKAREIIAGVTQEDGAASSHLLIPELQLLESYMLQQKNDEAISLANQLYPKFQQQLGTDNDLTLQILATRAGAEGQNGLWDESIRDELLIHEIAQRRDPHSFFALGVLSDAAMNECRRGHWEEGENYARQAWLAVQAEKSPQPALLAGTALTLASCLVRFGDQKDRAKLREAAGLLSETKNVSYAAALTGNPGFKANFTFAKAQLAFANGDRVTTAEYLHEAHAAFDSPEAERYQHYAVARFDKKLADSNLHR